MENRESQLSQLKVLISSGNPDNAALAYQIASGLDLQEELMQPWRDLWSLYSVKEADDIQILKTLCELNHIVLNNKELYEFPASLFMMPNLEIIDVSGNNIAELPEELFSMHKILKLDLSGNLLESVPEKLFQMQNLLCLDLSDNFLDDVPDFTGNISAINLAGNNFVSKNHPFIKNNNVVNDINGFFIDFSFLLPDEIWVLDRLLPNINFCWSEYCLCGGGCDQEYFPYEKIYEFSDELNESSHKIKGSFHRRYYGTGINLSELYEDAYEKFECNW